MESIFVRNVVYRRPMTSEDKIKLNREKFREIAEFMDLLRICFKNAHVTNLKKALDLEKVLDHT